MTAYADMTPHQKQAYTIETQRLADELVSIKPGSFERLIACQALIQRLSIEAAGIAKAKVDRVHAKQTATRARRAQERLAAMVG
jgi:hypothetical protein